MRMDEMELPVRVRADASEGEREECFARYWSCVEGLKAHLSELESRIERLDTSAVEEFELLDSEKKAVARRINTGQAHLASMMAMRTLSLHL